MDKDEAIKDMETAISKAWGLKYEGGLLVKELANLGYRKVGKDEIVLKKSEYEKLRLAKYKAMEEAIEYEKTAYKQLEQAKQETAREILITIHNNLKYATIKQTGTLISIKSLANELGIDLED